jgi:hypothetical protein
VPTEHQIWLPIQSASDLRIETNTHDPTLGFTLLAVWASDLRLSLLCHVRGTPGRLLLGRQFWEIRLAVYILGCPLRRKTTTTPSITSIKAPELEVFDRIPATRGRSASSSCSCIVSPISRVRVDFRRVIKSAQNDPVDPDSITTQRIGVVRLMIRSASRTEDTWAGTVISGCASIMPARASRKSNRFLAKSTLISNRTGDILCDLV